MNRVDVCICVYDVAVRRSACYPIALALLRLNNDHSLWTEKYMQALRALVSARSICAGDPVLHTRVIDFKLRREYSGL